MDLLDLLLGVFKCNHMYYIKEFFSIHFFAQISFFLSRLYSYWSQEMLHLHFAATITLLIECILIMLQLF